MLKGSLIGAGFALLLPVASAEAAVLSLSASVQGAFPTPEGGVEGKNDGSNLNLDPAIDGPTHQVTANVTQGGTVADANSEADTQLGLFKTSATITNPLTSIDPPSSYRYYAYGSNTLDQNVVANGTGSVQIDFVLDGAYDLSFLGESDEYLSHYAQLQFEGNNDVYDGTQSPITSGTGTVGQTLSMTANVVDGQAYRLYTYLISGIDAGYSGLGSVSGTAWLNGQLRISSEDGVTFTPEGPMSPVPLPAGIWMLMAGLGGIAFAGRKQLSA